MFALIKQKIFNLLQSTILSLLFVIRVLIFWYPPKLLLYAFFKKIGKINN